MSLELIKPDNSDFDRKVTALAARLGVEPVNPGPTVGMRLVLSAGDRHYDVFDLVNAVLDRLDTASK